MVPIPAGSFVMGSPESEPGRQPDEGTMNEHVQTATSRLLFNPLAPEVIRNPYPYYERLRTTDPMHLTPLGMYVASRHAEVSLVLRDKRFGKEYVERIIVSLIDYLDNIDNYRGAGRLYLP